MDKTLFDDLQQQLTTSGTEAAVDRLCDVLREQKDYNNLFYALLMKKRCQLGVNPIPTLPATQLPKEVHPQFEEAIRHAARTVGELYLGDGNIPSAFPYFNMLGESGPVAEALDRYRPTENDEHLDATVNIAYHQGVNPRRGFDLILDRYGLCSAITTLGGGQFPHGAEVRDYCIQRLVRALYEELRGRLIADITRQEGQMPDERTPVAELIQGRFWLFGDDLYHIDISHLGAVVQLSIHLSPDCPEFALARELCQYGERLSPRFQYASEPPFEKQYHDYGIYLSILGGENVDEGLNHFRQKVEGPDSGDVGTYPAEVLVNLLLRIGRADEALQVAGKYLVKVDERQLTCPGVVELCQRTGNYETLSRLAREHDNLVHYLAGLIAARGNGAAAR
jgi:hypothetical protein